MTFIFDFDRTLFNTGRLVKAFRSTAERRQIPADVYDAIRRVVGSEPPYNYKKHMQLIAEYRNHNKEDLQYLFSVAMKQSPYYLYDDVVPVLERLQDEGHTLILMTFGGEEYQRAKIEASGIQDFFDDIIVTETPNSKHLLDFEITNSHEVVFVNDNPTENVLFQEQYPSAMVLQMVRSDGIYAAAPQQKTIHSLTDLFEVVHT